MLGHVQILKVGRKNLRPLCFSAASLLPGQALDHSISASYCSSLIHNYFMFGLGKHSPLFLIFLVNLFSILSRLIFLWDFTWLCDFPPNPWWFPAAWRMSCKALGLALGALEPGASPSPFFRLTARSCLCAGCVFLGLRP